MAGEPATRGGRVSAVPTARLALARTCAWGLLVAGWIGIGSLALQFAPSIHVGFGLVASWLLALGAAAAVNTPVSLGRWPRMSALALVAAATVVGLRSTIEGGGMPALLLALVGWAALTALASGVVRRLRLVQSATPAPPVASATLGALVAGLAIGDPGDLQALAWRLAAFVGTASLLLVLLQFGVADRPRAPGCRAGLFDCSLPAWPAGAWRDTLQWPTLLAGLAMLPMMASLPLMAAWCRAEAIAPESMVLLHLSAMFVPALLLRRVLRERSAALLATVCVALLVTGAAFVLLAPSPFDLLGLAATHGAAWSLAWGGQLWDPARRGRKGTSPLAAAAGYALLTLGFGWFVERDGLAGLAAVHVALALAAAIGWIAGVAGFRGATDKPRRPAVGG